MTIDQGGALRKWLVLSPVIDGTSSRTPGKPRGAGARLSEKTLCPCRYRRGIAMSVEPLGVRSRACGCRLSGAALSACRAVGPSGGRTQMACSGWCRQEKASSLDRCLSILPGVEAAGSDKHAVDS